jgi:hypothetical protein
MRVGRHGVSLDWNGPGEPINVLIENINTERTTFSGVDTHDVGRDITIRKVRGRSSLDAGLQIRTSNVLVDDVRLENNGTNGVRVFAEEQANQVRLNNIRLRNIVCKNNAARGILSAAPIDIDGAHIEGNGLGYTGAFPFSDVGGIYLPAGKIRNAVIVNNQEVAVRVAPPNVNAANFGMVTISETTAPASANQVTFVSSAPPGFGASSPVEVNNSSVVGYAEGRLFRRGDGSSTAITGVAHKNTKFGNSPMTGNALLVGGVATVSNNNIVGENYFTDGRWRTHVVAHRVEPRTSTELGQLNILLSNGQISITSRTATNTIASGDVSRVEWSIL